MRFLRDVGITLAILAILMAGVGYLLTRNGLSARTDPPAIEAFMARHVRRLSMPSNASRAMSPVARDPSAWTEGGRAFQEHCAVCHDEGGSGRSEVGQNLYPKVPDMRKAQTQELTDGELFFVIQNGIRYTGMPAWERELSASDTWKMVSFIRRLPRLTPDELEQVMGSDRTGGASAGGGDSRRDPGKSE
ncbi:MAG TPA: c-type cytochrome [Vicinamibacterales bacterium]|jgi:mono/diheme cytochrome c family protein